MGARARKGELIEGELIANVKHFATTFAFTIRLASTASPNFSPRPSCPSKWDQMIEGGAGNNSASRRYCIALDMMSEWMGWEEVG